jgi:allantoate deiminase
VVIFDIRSGSEAARARLAESLKAGIRAIADKRHLALTITSTREVATTPCHAQVQNMLGESVRALGAEPVRLNSGAGHDGQAMAKLCPIGMLFVRCRGGVSHNPMEYASPRDLGLAGRGADRLYRALRSGQAFATGQPARDAAVRNYPARVKTASS